MTLKGLGVKLLGKVQEHNIFTPPVRFLIRGVCRARVGSRISSDLSAGPTDCFLAPSFLF